MYEGKTSMVADLLYFSIKQGDQVQRGLGNGFLAVSEENRTRWEQRA